MPEFSKKPSKFKHAGLQWNRPVDDIPEEQICFGRNIRVGQGDTITQRPGLTAFLANAGGVFYHSIAVLNNFNTNLIAFTKVYIFGYNDSGAGKISVGDTAANIALTSPVKLPPAGATNTLSGNPLTMVDMAPVGTNIGWKYIGDSTQNFAVGYYPGDTTVNGTGNNGGMARAITMGMTPPVNTTVPTVVAAGLLTGDYQWMFAYRNRFTGARSNPSAPTRVTLAAPALTLAAQKGSLVVPATPIDPQTGSADGNILIDIYRFGGTINDWRYVGTAESGATHVDNLADSEILTAATPPQVTDPTTGATRFNLFRPFIYQDNAVYSTGATPGPATPGLITVEAKGTFILTAQGTDVFKTNWLPGSVISINNNAWTIFQVRSTTVLEIAEDPGANLTTGSFYAWATLTGTLTAGAALPHIWGPYGIGSGGAFVFGCGGSNTDAGTLYWCNGNDPDSTDIVNSVVVTSPSEPLRGGCIYDGTPFCWSTERMFRIYPGTIPGQFTTQEIPGGKGIWAEYSLTVQSNGISDQSVTWVGKDGIYDWSNSAGLQCLTNRDLYPFFPHDNQAGQNLLTLFPFITESHPVNAPDFTLAANIKYHRLCWFMGELFYDFPSIVSAANVYHTLVFDSKQCKGWVSLDQYSNGVAAATASPVCRGIEIAANNMKLGVGNWILDYTGTNDAGIAVPCRLITRQDDQGDPRGLKLYGDYMFDALAGNASGGISVIPRVAAAIVSLPTATITDATRTQNVFATQSTGLGALYTTFGFDITWTNGSSPVILYQYEIAYVPKPEVTGLRATDKTDDGYNGAKYLRGLCIESNTANTARTVRVLVDGATAATLTVNTGTSTQAELPFAITPIVGSEFQLQPTDGNSWELFSIRWVWEKWPDLTVIQSNWLNLGTSKPKYIRSFSVPVSGPASPTLSFTATYDGASTYGTSAVAPVSISAKSPAQFSFIPPILAHQLKLTPSSACRVWYEEIVWDAEEWPELATMYGPVEKLGDSGAKYLRGFELPMETGAANVVMALNYDNQALPTAGQTLTETFPQVVTAALSKNVFPFTPAAPIIAHEFQLLSNGPARFWYNEIKWDFEPWPEFDTGKSPWLDGGIPGAKFIRGIVIPIDTAGAPVTFDLVYSGGSVVMGPFTTTLSQKTAVPFAFIVPLILHEFQLTPRTACRVWYEEAKWDFEPWPELTSESSPWLDGGTPGAKWVKGLVIPLDTGGASVTFNLVYDGGTINMGPFITTDGQKTSVSWAFTVPLVIHEFLLTPQTPCRVWYQDIKWDADPWPELKAESSSWMNAGTPGAKFMQGVVIPMDTGGSSVTYDLLYDGGATTVGSFATPAARKTPVPYSFPVPFIAHELLLTPRTVCRTWYEEIKWVWEPVPELVTTYTTQATDHDLPGYHYLFDAYIAYIGSSDAPRFTVTTDYGSITYTLPVSNNTYTRAYLLLNPQKAKWRSYSITSTGGIRLFLKDCEVRVKNWTDKGQYPSSFQSHHPFGDESRISGAKI